MHKPIYEIEKSGKDSRWFLKISYGEKAGDLIMVAKLAIAKDLANQFWDMTQQIPTDFDRAMQTATFGR